MTTTRVVTWQDPTGMHRLNICRTCEERLTRAGEWPKTRNGEEYARVHMGEHRGICDVHPATATAK